MHGLENLVRCLKTLERGWASKIIVFCKWSESGVILLVVYIDDIVIIGNDTLDIQPLKTLLHSQIHIKDLGMLNYFLGIGVIRTKKGILLS